MSANLNNKLVPKMKAALADVMNRSQVSREEPDAGDDSPYRHTFHAMSDRLNAKLRSVPSRRAASAGTLPRCRRSRNTPFETEFEDDFPLICSENISVSLTETGISGAVPQGESDGSETVPREVGANNRVTPQSSSTLIQTSCDRDKEKNVMMTEKGDEERTSASDCGGVTRSDVQRSGCSDTIMDIAASNSADTTMDAATASAPTTPMPGSTPFRTRHSRRPVSLPRYPRQTTDKVVAYPECFPQPQQSLSHEPATPSVEDLRPRLPKIAITRGRNGVVRKKLIYSDETEVVPSRLRNQGFDSPIQNSLVDETKLTRCSQTRKVKESKCQESADIENGCSDRRRLRRSRTSNAAAANSSMVSVRKETAKATHYDSAVIHLSNQRETRDASSSDINSVPVEGSRSSPPASGALTSPTPQGRGRCGKSRRSGEASSTAIRQAPLVRAVRRYARLGHIPQSWPLSSSEHISVMSKPRGMGDFLPDSGSRATLDFRNFIESESRSATTKPEKVVRSRKKRRRGGGRRIENPSLAALKQREYRARRRAMASRPVESARTGCGRGFAVPVDSASSSCSPSSFAPTNAKVEGTSTGVDRVPSIFEESGLSSTRMNLRSESADQVSNHQPSDEDHVHPTLSDNSSQLKRVNTACLMSDSLSIDRDFPSAERSLGAMDPLKAEKSKALCTKTMFTTSESCALKKRRKLRTNRGKGWKRSHEHPSPGALKMREYRARRQAMGGQPLGRAMKKQVKQNPATAEFAIASDSFAGAPTDADKETASRVVGVAFSNLEETSTVSAPEDTYTGSQDDAPNLPTTAGSHGQLSTAEKSAEAEHSNSSCSVPDSFDAVGCPPASEPNASSAYALEAKKSESMSTVAESKAPRHSAQNRGRNRKARRGRGWRYRLENPSAGALRMRQYRARLQAMGDQPLKCARKRCVQDEAHSDSDASFAGFSCAPTNSDLLNQSTCEVGNVTLVRDRRAKTDTHLLRCPERENCPQQTNAGGTTAQKHESSSQMPPDSLTVDRSLREMESSVVTVDHSNVGDLDLASVAAEPAAGGCCVHNEVPSRNKKRRTGRRHLGNPSLAALRQREYRARRQAMRGQPVEQVERKLIQESAAVGDFTAAIGSVDADARTDADKATLSGSIDHAVATSQKTTTTKTREDNMESERALPNMPTNSEGFTHPRTVESQRRRRKRKRGISRPFEKLRIQRLYRLSRGLTLGGRSRPDPKKIEATDAIPELASLTDRTAGSADLPDKKFQQVILDEKMSAKGASGTATSRLKPVIANESSDRLMYAINPTVRETNTVTVISADTALLTTDPIGAKANIILPDGDPNAAPVAIASPGDSAHKPSGYGKRGRRRRRGSCGQRRLPSGETIAEYKLRMELVHSGRQLPLPRGRPTGPMLLLDRFLRYGWEPQCKKDLLPTPDEDNLIWETVLEVSTDVGGDYSETFAKIEGEANRLYEEACAVTEASESAEIEKEIDAGDNHAGGRNNSDGSSFSPSEYQPIAASQDALAQKTDTQPPRKIRRVRSLEEPQRSVHIAYRGERGEQVDVIDGFRFVSFRSASTMGRFTRREEQRIRRLRRKERRRATRRAAVAQGEDNEAAQSHDLPLADRNGLDRDLLPEDQNVEMHPMNVPEVDMATSNREVAAEDPAPALDEDADIGTSNHQVTSAPTTASGSTGEDVHSCARGRGRGRHRGSRLSSGLPRENRSFAEKYRHARVTPCAVVASSDDSIATSAVPDKSPPESTQYNRGRSRQRNPYEQIKKIAREAFAVPPQVPTQRSCIEQNTARTDQVEALAHAPQGSSDFGVFSSQELDDYLRVHGALNISFRIPGLAAAATVVRTASPPATIRQQSSVQIPPQSQPQRKPDEPRDKTVLERLFRLGYCNREELEEGRTKLLAEAAERLNTAEPLPEFESLPLNSVLRPRRCPTSPCGQHVPFVSRAGRLLLLSRVTDRSLTERRSWDLRSTRGAFLYAYHQHRQLLIRGSVSRNHDSSGLYDHGGFRIATPGGIVRSKSVDAAVNVWYEHEYCVDTVRVDCVVAQRAALAVCADTCEMTVRSSAVPQRVKKRKLVASSLDQRIEERNRKEEMTRDAKHENDEQREQVQLQEKTGGIERQAQQTDELPHMYYSQQQLHSWGTDEEEGKASVSASGGKEREMMAELGMYHDIVMGAEKRSAECPMSSAHKQDFKSVKAVQHRTDVSCCLGSAGGCSDTHVDGVTGDSQRILREERELVGKSADKFRIMTPRRTEEESSGGKLGGETASNQGKPAESNQVNAKTNTDGLPSARPTATRNSTSSRESDVPEFSVGAGLSLDQNSELCEESPVTGALPLPVSARYRTEMLRLGLPPPYKTEKSIALCEDQPEVCSKEFCRLGCICSSLACPRREKEHCGQADCMLVCSCIDGTAGLAPIFPDASQANQETALHSLPAFGCEQPPSVAGGRAKRARKVPSRYAKQDVWYEGPLALVSENGPLPLPSRPRLMSTDQHQVHEEDLLDRQYHQLACAVEVHVPFYQLPSVRPYCFIHHVHDCQEYARDGSCCCKLTRHRLQQLGRNIALRSRLPPTISRLRQEHSARTFARRKAPTPLEFLPQKDSCLLAGAVYDGAQAPRLPAPARRVLPVISLPKPIDVLDVALVVSIVPSERVVGEDIERDERHRHYAVRLRDGNLSVLSGKSMPSGITWRIQLANDVVVMDNSGRRFRNPSEGPFMTHAMVEGNAEQLRRVPLVTVNCQVKNGRSRLGNSDGGIILYPNKRPMSSEVATLHRVDMISRKLHDDGMVVVRQDICGALLIIGAVEAESEEKEWMAEAVRILRGVADTVKTDAAVRHMLSMLDIKDARQLGAADNQLVSVTNHETIRADESGYRVVKTAATMDEVKADAITSKPVKSQPNKQEEHRESQPVGGDNEELGPLTDLSESAAEKAQRSELATGQAVQKVEVPSYPPRIHLRVENGKVVAMTQEGKKLKVAKTASGHGLMIEHAKRSRWKVAIKGDRVVTNTNFGNSSVLSTSVSCLPASHDKEKSAVSNIAQASCGVSLADEQRMVKGKTGTEPSIRDVGPEKKIMTIQRQEREALRMAIMAAQGMPIAVQASPEPPGLPRWSPSTQSCTQLTVESTGQKPHVRLIRHDKRMDVFPVHVPTAAQDTHIRSSRTAGLKTTSNSATPLDSSRFLAPNLHADVHPAGLTETANQSLSVTRTSSDVTAAEGEPNRENAQLLVGPDNETPLNIRRVVEKPSSQQLPSVSEMAVDERPSGCNEAAPLDEECISPLCMDTVSSERSSEERLERRASASPLARSKPHSDREAKSSSLSLESSASSAEEKASYLAPSSKQEQNSNALPNSEEDREVNGHSEVVPDIPTKSQTSQPLRPSASSSAKANVCRPLPGSKKIVPSNHGPVSKVTLSVSDPVSKHQLTNEERPHANEQTQSPQSSSHRSSASRKGLSTGARLSFVRRPPQRVLGRMVTARFDGKPSRWNMVELDKLPDLMHVDGILISLTKRYIKHAVHQVKNTGRPVSTKVNGVLVTIVWMPHLPDFVFLGPVVEEHGQSTGSAAAVASGAAPTKSVSGVTTFAGPGALTTSASAVTTLTSPNPLTTSASAATTITSSTGKAVSSPRSKPAIIRAVRLPSGQRLKASPTLAGKAASGCAPKTVVIPRSPETNSSTSQVTATTIVIPPQPVVKTKTIIPPVVAPPPPQPQPLPPPQLAAADIADPLLVSQELSATLERPGTATGEESDDDDIVVLPPPAPRAPLDVILLDNSDISDDELVLDTVTQQSETSPRAAVASDAPSASAIPDSQLVHTRAAPDHQKSMSIASTSTTPTTATSIPGSQLVHMLTARADQKSMSVASINTTPTATAASTPGSQLVHTPTSRAGQKFISIASTKTTMTTSILASQLVRTPTARADQKFMSMASTTTSPTATTTSILGSQLVRAPTAPTAQKSMPIVSTKTTPTTTTASTSKATRFTATPPVIPPSRSIPPAGLKTSPGVRRPRPMETNPPDDRAPVSTEASPQAKRRKLSLTERSGDSAVPKPPLEPLASPRQRVFDRNEYYDAKRSLEQLLYGRLENATPIKRKTTLVLSAATTEVATQRSQHTQLKMRLWQLSQKQRNLISRLNRQLADLPLEKRIEKIAEIEDLLSFLQVRVEDDGLEPVMLLEKKTDQMPSQFRVIAPDSGAAASGTEPAEFEELSEM